VNIDLTACLELGSSLYWQMMNRTHKLRALTLLVATGTGLVACAGAPVQDMSNARQTIRAAHEAGAMDYSPDNLRAADKSLQNAKQAIDLRKYQEARREARAATRSAAAARNMALAIASAQSAIENARLKNFPADQAEAVLKQAIAAAAQGDEEKTIELALKARALAEKGEAERPQQ